MRTRVGLLVSALALSLSWLAVVEGGDQPIDAVKLVLKRSSRGSETMLFLSEDSAFLFPPVGSADDPAEGTPGGLVVELFALGDGTTSASSVPGGTATWKVKTGKRARYKFTNKGAPNETSPIKVVLLKDGKMLKVVSKEIAFSPTAASEGVAVRVTTGSLRDCAVFGPGTIKMVKERKLVAKGASRAGLADCSDEALLGAVTTTTLGGTTTTTASSTTTTVSSSTTTTFPTTPPPDPATVAPAIDPTVSTRRCAFSGPEILRSSLASQWERSIPDASL